MPTAVLFGGGAAGEPLCLSLREQLIGDGGDRRKSALVF